MGTEVMTWVDVFLLRRQYQIVLKDQNFLEVERQKWALEQEQNQKRLSDHRQFTYFYNFYFVQCAALLIFLALGVVVGLNLPEEILCHSRHTPCYFLRVRPKIAGN
jgi:hypothetical protein